MAGVDEGGAVGQRGSFRADEIVKMVGVPTIFTVPCSSYRWLLGSLSRE
jgi:hypothetical protein